MDSQKDGRVLMQHSSHIGQSDTEGVLCLAVVWCCDSLLCSGFIVDTIAITSNVDCSNAFELPSCQ